ncbi:putative amino acid/polyamine transporter I [Heterostelium album PN500]|uniref:Putative amino acid/polyamine transporter I n=1 Tax=Heterostelium pallidum (strain ATCC 26659 / Pp 5 / PN500) TaxID=670386 RepID=D3BVK0_HETP5|nr:putative amino acid/polyamine transporter I [Heterostelium album PN500]EFA74503.1 putative amino acid/polyamine transporter I [Heterostelium album PN500]|eukprot:XP_020426637.1 putative amino acid/polyamine transporter I [Heterostelium album PN500]
MTVDVELKTFADLEIYNTKNNSDSAILTNDKAQHDNELKKNTLGLVHCIAMSISGIGPTCGIFFVVGQIAKVAGANVPFTLMLATICCLSMASTISTFGKYVYSSASFYCYVSEGLGGTTGFITGWFMLVGYGILTVQTVVQFSSWTADVFTNNLNIDFPWIACAVFVLLFIGALAFIGINPALKISLVLVSCETVILLVLTTIIVAKGGDQGNYPLAFTPVGKYSGGFSGLSRGLVFSILVFVGFETAAILGAETKDPKKTIPRAVVGSVLITAVWMIWDL